MSTASGESAVHIDCDDVNKKVKENGSMVERSCDSGLDTLESYSGAGPPSSDSDVSPIKHEVDDHLCEVTTNEQIPINSRLSTVCDSGAAEVLSLDSPNHVSTKDFVTNIHFSTKCESEESSLCNDPNTDNLKESDLNYSNINLATSSVSLDGHITSENYVIGNSMLSKSAENISCNQTNDTSSNSSEKELNAEKILSEFTCQKGKASAVQKIPENAAVNQISSVSVNPDIRYSRIPKEILSQDLGSIVKNVHGIFSSVSGSLKSAYTHRTVQKPVKVAKGLPNGKLMNDIFEDDNTDPKAELSIEKTVDNHASLQDLNTEYTVTKVNDSDSDHGDTKTDILKFQIESLERLLLEQRKENASLRETVKQQCDELQQKDQTFKELDSKLDSMGKRVDYAEREKDAAVMRYASVECAAIEAKRAAENAARAEKNASAEVELLNNKLKGAHAEKQRIIQLYDDKCHELMGCDRELAKTREELRELEGRLKWTQSKLRVEMDAYKDSSERAEKLAQQVAELESAKDVAAANANDSLKARQLESELKENRATLILCRHERDELERRLTVATQQLDSTTRDRDEARSSLNTATAEVERLKMSVLRLEEEAAELAALRAKAALADTLSAQLERETERAVQAEEALSQERAIAETCGRREASALEHAARVTALQVAQSAAAAKYEAEARALSVETESLRERVTLLESECAKLAAARTDEAERRTKETRQLARKVAELTEELAEVINKLEWEKGENGVLKKKHASAIKELNRELQRALKRSEQLEAKLSPADAPDTRTGSISSLSSGESAPQEERLQNGHSDAVPDIQVREPDRQTLIERIVSLQRAAARRAERCDFLEEHARQLTTELRSKARLLRHLLTAMPAGAVASQQRDANKKEIARLGGGAMAAVWGGDPGGLTPELSLEMNKRLQAVLEDTLLKNITLKENMDTLGAEISRLKEQLKATNDSK